MQPAVPCSICRTTGGSLKANTHRPARVSIVRFGLTGVACWACYATVRARFLRGADPASGKRLAPGVPDFGPVPEF